MTTGDGLVDLINEAYGDGSLGLHRGHQDVEGTLIDVLGISHDEMHVRMETQGQNLAAVATTRSASPGTARRRLRRPQPSASGTMMRARRSHRAANSILATGFGLGHGLALRRHPLRPRHRGTTSLAAATGWGLDRLVTATGRARSDDTDLISMTSRAIAFR